MTDEEALFVVVGVDESAGDAVGSVADDFAGLGFEDIDAVDSDLCPVVSGQRKREVPVLQTLERSERLSPLRIRPTSAACV